MKQFLKWMSGFFENNDNGGSMRKAVVIWIMILITRIHNKYLETAVKGSSDFDFAETLVYVDYVVLCLMIGVIVAQDLYKFKWFSKEEPKKEEEKKPEN